MFTSHLKYILRSWILLVTTAGRASAITTSFEGTRMILRISHYALDQNQNIKILKEKTDIADILLWLSYLGSDKQLNWILLL